MLSQIRPAIVMTLAFTLLTGVAYPLTMTGIGQSLFPYQANGSRIERDGNVIGSNLIGQNFTDPGYFWSRPSATGTDPYNASASSGSNYGATDRRLVDRVAAAVDGRSTVPADAVTTSGSGLDPHISPENARSQMDRIATARGVDRAAIARLVSDMTEAPALGIFGEYRVNVLALNLALDGLTQVAR
ncbi:potassium-transporting ATPase subunit KdpC [Devosia chinhatensis]|uniref:Potassium-transporting ATPase KdpC subunit n=1 Tax=Devosia chinhatensis TaxID=429727 RepID=A0A0F5FIG2_9HYPH|nr:potassium-transporting ATPase subunit KdpC [Devosia chinhatensis]KKB08626.1 ATPase [Devosia chinhatensis]